MADFKNLDSILGQAVASKKVPGVVAVAATDKRVVYEGAFGVREIGKPAPMTLDTVVWIASMTKAITATAAMQLVERGKLALERPASEVVPEVGAAQVLEGFDAAGKPRLRAPKRPITLRHLLTHTAGFSYEIWSPAIAQFQQATGTPGITTCTNAALGTPLLELAGAGDERVTGPRGARARVLRERLVGEHKAMAHHLGREVTHVLGEHELAAPNQGQRLASEDEVE